MEAKSAAELATGVSWLDPEDPDDQERITNRIGNRGQSVVIAAFDGGHRRIGVIEMSKDVCSICKWYKIVIGIDSSEQEYKTGRICHDCASRIFNDESPTIIPA